MHSASVVYYPLDGTSTVLSLAHEDKEDNIRALMTFSLSLNTTAPSHVSTKPQRSKNKNQKSKMFHSKPKSHTTLTKKHSPNVGMRSNHSFKKNQPSPMANANGMVFNSYLKINYGRNQKSSPDAYNLMISCSCGKLPGCTTHAPHIFHVHLHVNPHIMCQNTCNTAPPMLPCGKCVKLLSD